MRNPGCHLTDCGKTIGALHMLLETLLGGDVRQIGDRPLQAPIVITDQAGIEQHRNSGPVPATNHSLASPTAALWCLLKVGYPRSGVTGKLGGVTPENLLTLEPQHPHCGAVGERYPSAGIGNENRLLGAFHRSNQPPAVLDEPSAFEGYRGLSSDPVGNRHVKLREGPSRITARKLHHPVKTIPAYQRRDKHGSHVEGGSMEAVRCRHNGAMPKPPHPLKVGNVLRGGAAARRNVRRSSCRPRQRHRCMYQCPLPTAQYRSSLPRRCAARSQPPFQGFRLGGSVD